MRLGTSISLSSLSLVSHAPFSVAAFDFASFFSGAAPSDAITHTRAGNATMVDSDGLLKWAPHNLLTYSEDFSNVAYVKDAGVSIGTVNNPDPDGGTSATLINVTNNGRIYRNKAEVISKCATFIKAGTFSHFFIHGAFIDLVAKTASSGVLTELNNGWFLFTSTGRSITRPFQIQAYPDNTYSIHTTAGSYYIWGAHLYRSDLGGMVNNPDRGDSYVPTTSAAVYLPRRGHHVYNGTSWVNEGLLHESEQRVNLIEYSEDFTDASWVKGDLTAFGAGSEANTLATLDPAGGNGAAYVKDDGDGVNSPHRLLVVNQTLSSGTLSCWLKAADYDYGFLGAGDLTNGGGAIFNLSDGSVAETNNAGTFVLEQAAVESFGNGWYRCSIYFTGASNLGTEILAVGMNDDATGDWNFAPQPRYASNTPAGIYIYGAQFEAGSTPSSYIPTSGSTVTRAAETLPIPAAKLPWPTPNVIGPELWNTPTISDPAVWSWDGSTLTATGDGTSDIARGDAVTAGGLYQISFTVGASGSGLFQVRVGNTFIATLTGGANQSYSYLTVATDTTGLTFTDTGSTTAVISNISVREIDPLAVSIQMQGRMDYADTRVDLEGQLFRWQIDTSNRIDARLTTTGSITGQINFRQSASGVTDTVSSSITAYSPGINVPFNIASRHGSTFLNGAIDGTALTADTTPVALPDLETTDLQLGFDYMGTIKQFRVWGRDIGDTGIAEESA